MTLTYLRMLYPCLQAQSQIVPDQDPEPPLCIAIVTVSLAYNSRSLRNDMQGCDCGTLHHLRWAYPESFRFQSKPQLQFVGRHGHEVARGIM